MIHSPPQVREGATGVFRDDLFGENKWTRTIESFSAGTRRKTVVICPGSYSRETPSRTRMWDWKRTGGKITAGPAMIDGKSAGKG
jgi:hypothetical protein